MVSRDCCVVLPRGATGLSAVYDCGIPGDTHLLFSIPNILKICMYGLKKTHFTMNDYGV